MIKLTTTGTKIGLMGLVFYYFSVVVVGNQPWCNCVSGFMTLSKAKYCLMEPLCQGLLILWNCNELSSRWYSRIYNVELSPKWYSRDHKIGFPSKENSKFVNWIRTHVNNTLK